MRIFCSIAVLLLVGGTYVAGQPPEQSGVAEEPIVRWQTPFSPVFSSGDDDQLVILVITSDPPWNGQRRETQSARAESIWCQRDVNLSLQRLFIERPSLKQRLHLQAISAGLPVEITGGKPSQRPSQSVVAIANSRYQLLALAIGVPDAAELATLIEDADETRLLLRRFQDDPYTVSARLADRSRARIGRIWNEQLDQLRESFETEDEFAWLTDQAALRRHVRRLSNDLRSVYRLDVKLRFGLTEESNLMRRLVVEQHVAARRPWCEAAVPFVVGIDLQRFWRLLVESIWDRPPIHDDGSESLLVWFRTQLESGAVVLQLEPPMHLEHMPWPPPTDSFGRRRGLPWSDIHALVLQHAYRLVDAAAVAQIIRNTDLMPIDLYQSTPVRYLLIQPNKRQIHVVRESDPPSRFAGILRRSRATLVKN